MFSKLGQHSTSWWICVTITGIFATILVTVVAYPAYAALCVTTCTDEDVCGSLPFCSSCNTGLNGGDFTHKAQVNALIAWASPNPNSRQCYGRVDTFHSTEGTNLSDQEQIFNATYRSLIIKKSGVLKCNPTYPSLVNGESDYSFVIPVGETRSHSRSQSVTYTLGTQDVACTYEGQAVTQVNYDGEGNADVQCPDDEKPEIDVADNCN